MIRRPPRSTRTDTRFPYTTLFRSHMRSLLDSGFEKAMDIRIADVAVPPLPHARPARGEIQLASADASVTATATPVPSRSEEHTSELQSLMRISYAVFCLKKKKQKHNYPPVLI